jgi:hypothetical protein
MPVTSRLTPVWVARAQTGLPDLAARRGRLSCPGPAVTWQSPDPAGVWCRLAHVSDLICP